MAERIFENMTLTEFLEMIDAANPVFWVCPKGCRGGVTWTSDCSDAKCDVCGMTRLEDHKSRERGGE